jgi:hypothetical protein
VTVGSLLPPPIRTIASNLARRRRKNHGFEPHIGKLFPPPFPSFFLPRFFGFFPPSLLPAAFLCQRLPSLFLPLTALFSPIFPPATHVLHASSFRCFVSAHQSSVFIPRSGTPASASGANVVSPCSSPHLAPFAPSRLPCCLGPSPALLSASLLNSLSPSLFLSLSPVLFSPRPPLLLSVLSSTGRLPVPRTPVRQTRFPTRVSASQLALTKNIGWNILTRGESYRNHHRGKQGRSIVIPAPNATIQSGLSLSPGSRSSEATL